MTQTEPEIAGSTRFFSSLLEVLEYVSDFLSGFFRVIDGHMLAFFGTLGRVGGDIFAGINNGVVRNDKRILRAIGGLYGNFLLILFHILDSAPPGMGCFFPRPLHGT